MARESWFKGPSLLASAPGHTLIRREGEYPRQPLMAVLIVLSIVPVYLQGLHPLVLLTSKTLIPLNFGLALVLWYNHRARTLPETWVYLAFFFLAATLGFLQVYGTKYYPGFLESIRQDTIFIPMYFAVSIYVLITRDLTPVRLSFVIVGSVMLLYGLTGDINIFYNLQAADRSYRTSFLAGMENPNAYGSTMYVSIFFFCTYLYDMVIKRQRLLLLISLITIGLMVIAIIGTGSRGNTIRVFGFLFVVFNILAAQVYKQNIFLRLSVIGVVLTIVFFGLSFVVENTLVGSRLLDTAIEGSLGEARTAIISNAILVWMESPVVGVGFGVPDLMAWLWGPAIRPHCEPLFILASTGVIGFSFYVIFFYMSLKRALTVPLPSRQNYERKVFLAFFAFKAMTSINLYPFFSINYVLILFAYSSLYYTVMRDLRTREATQTAGSSTPFTGRR